jgi:hypothetical protein
LVEGVDKVVQERWLGNAEAVLSALSRKVGGSLGTRQAKGGSLADSAQAGPTQRLNLPASRKPLVFNHPT